MPRVAISARLITGRPSIDEIALPPRGTVRAGGTASGSPARSSPGRPGNPSFRQHGMTMLASRCLLQFRASLAALDAPLMGVLGRGEARRPTGPLPRRCVRCRPSGRARRPPSDCRLSGRPEVDLRSRSTLPGISDPKASNATSKPPANLVDGARKRYSWHMEFASATTTHVHGHCPGAPPRPRPAVTAGLRTPRGRSRFGLMIAPVLGLVPFDPL